MAYQSKVEARLPSISSSFGHNGERETSGDEDQHGLESMERRFCSLEFVLW